MRLPSQTAITFRRMVPVVATSGGVRPSATTRCGSCCMACHGLPALETLACVAGCHATIGNCNCALYLAPPPAPVF